MLEDLTGCPHITTQIRAVSVHSGMQVGARVSPTGDIWWCVGCGILFSDEQAKRPLAIPSQTADRAAVLREALDVVPQDICMHDGCEESTCPLTRVNVAISGLLVETPLRPSKEKTP